MAENKKELERAEGNRQEKKKTVIEKLKVFFEKYFGVI